MITTRRTAWLATILAAACGCTALRGDPDDGVAAPDAADASSAADTAVAAREVGTPDASFADGSDAHDGRDAAAAPDHVDVAPDRLGDGSAGCDVATCGGACVDLRTDPANCGGCGLRCPAGGACVAGACACPAGTLRCADACTILARDPLNCGACGRVCPIPPGAVASNCTGGSCAFLCSPGTMPSGTACVPIPPPRPVAPLSTATVTSRRPTLRWELATGTDGANVEICRTRACDSGDVVWSSVEVGSSVVLPMDLAHGVWFWRLSGRAGGPVGARTSPVWQFTVGASTAPISTSWGSVLDVDGDGHADVAVGEPGRTGDGHVGRVHVYYGSAGPRVLRGEYTTVVDPDAGTGEFGYSVASAGDVNGDGYADVVVGAHFALGGRGRVHVYLGASSGLQATPASITNPDADGDFGWSVASAGDVNGDGYADVVVGARVAARGAGRVHVYLGGPSGLGATPTSFANPDAGGEFGHSVASAGDVNGDGFADVVVWASQAGRVHVYLGGPTGLRAGPTSFNNPTAGGGLGAEVASAGDVNADGYADVIVGGGFADRVHVYLGGSSGVGAVPVSLTSPDPGGGFGWAVASAGDVNADGFADIVVGAPFAAIGAGRAYSYLGRSIGLEARYPSFTGSAGTMGVLGAAVASAGDVNGDGYADVVVGAPDTGEVHLYLGGPSGLSPTPIVVTGPAAGAQFGRSVAGADDTRGDGHAGAVG